MPRRSPPTPRAVVKVPPSSPAHSVWKLSLIARPAQAARRPMFEDISNEEFRAFQKLQAAAALSDAQSNPEGYYRVRAPPLWGIACVTIILLILYTGWSVWLYYFTRTRVWPLPRGPLNATDGLLHRLTIATRALIPVLSLLSLSLPLGMFMRTRVPGRARSFSAFTCWIAFCFFAGLIPLMIYFSFLCFMQDRAFSTACDASEEITAIFVASSRGLVGDRTTASLYKTSDPGDLFAKYTLTKVGSTGAQFAWTEGPGPYFRVAYGVGSDNEHVTAKAYTSETGAISFTAAGTLKEMVISPDNSTLRAVGEVQERPLNFRLVDNPPVLPNGTVEGLGTIGKDVVLRSLATDPLSCRGLKLCAKGIDDPETRAQVLIPMGWALYKHSMYSFVC